MKSYSEINILKNKDKMPMLFVDLMANTSALVLVNILSGTSRNQ